MREGQHEQEDRDDHPGGPHPPVGLVDAQSSDRVKPAAADGDQLDQHEHGDPRENDIAHVRHADPHAVEKPFTPAGLHPHWHLRDELHDDRQKARIIEV